jgi:hypothetical protein
LDRANLKALPTILLEDGVGPTNNRVERALRFAVLRRRMMQECLNENGGRENQRRLRT